MADSVLKTTDIQNAIAVIDQYISICNNLFERLQSTIGTLTAPDSNFNGEAQLGYNDFFVKITPALTENLTAPDVSLTAKLRAMLEAIRETLLVQVDPQLGNANRSAGSAGGQTE